MGYRARMELPSGEAYIEIFRRAAAHLDIAVDQEVVEYVLGKYSVEGRPMRSCEPRDLLNRVTDICVFQGNQGNQLNLTPELIDLAWRNYFGASHEFRAPELIGQARVASVQA